MLRAIDCLSTKGRPLGRVLDMLMLACAIGLLSACSTVLNSPERDQQLLTEQIAGALPLTADAGRPPPLYLGLALFGETMVFDNDVSQFGQRVATAAGGPGASVILSNRPQRTGTRTRALASAPNVQRLFRAAGQRKARDQLSVILLSSHGNRQRLFISTPDQPRPVYMTPRNLDDMLDALGGPQVVIVSACYSGSMIQGIQAPDRLIMTATDANNVSFGCSDRFDHTVFVEALMKHLFEPVPLGEAFQNARLAIAERERLFFDSKSNPQIHAGEQVANWLEQSFETLLKGR